MPQSMKSYRHEIPQDLTLRRCLKAMFHYQDVDKVIDALLINNHYLYKSSLAEQLNVLLRFEPEGCTIDQNESCSKLFVQRFENGIFDALFEFSKSCCLLIDNQIACKFKSVLRWHEMSTLLSEDLLVCAYMAAERIIPKDFAWSPYINTDCVKLNDILNEKLVDIHAHLKGSSLNFDVNWICLMNHIEERESIFKEIQNGLQHKAVFSIYKNSQRSYYMLSVLACAIRIVLFSRIKGIKTKTEDFLKLNIISSNSDLVANTLRNSITIDVKSFEPDAYKYIDNENLKGVWFDYAHTNDIKMPEKEGCAFSSLSGERRLLYAVLGMIRNNTLNEYDTSLFYIYLLVKHKIRHELIQTNEETGFKNFQLYDKRKTLFVAEHPAYAQYRTLLHHLSVGSMFGSDKDNRGLETRISPHENSEKLNYNIKKLDSQITDGCLKHNPTGWNYGYVLHYIKVNDNCYPAYFSLKVRHQDLRDKVKQQAKAIVQSRKKEDERIAEDLMLTPRIHGIDAASSEIECRPEVFAQAFRFCRRSIPNIGITYHAGEDFHDVIDGLRAIEECIRFLGMRSADRFGHALVLGIDVQDYYHKRRNVIAMPKQVAMDNAMWLYVKLGNCFLYREVRNELHEMFNQLFMDIFKDFGDLVDIDIYYQSWLLRGDNPTVYRQDGSIVSNDDVDENWHKENCSMRPDAEKARTNLDVCKLFYYYHRNQRVKEAGAEIVVVEYQNSLIKAIEFAQKRMIRMVDKKGLCIECNPTSNFKIGEINRYEDHPISKFHAKGLTLFAGRHISSSINTDDKGVFATSIEREYALISAALIRRFGDTKYAEKKVWRWLEDIRQHSIEQKFVK